MDEPPPPPRYGRQMLGSLIAAVLIVIGVIWAVTARLGPTSIAELEAREEAAEEEAEAREEAAEADRGEGSGKRRRGRN